MMDKKESIINFLKEHGRTSTTAISVAVSLNIHYALRYLNELKREKKITKEQETFGCYWSVK